MAREYSGVKLDVTFTKASTRENIISAENIALSFGKLAKWYTDFAWSAWTAPTVEVTGNGNAITSASYGTGANANKLTLTKGTTFLTSSTQYISSITSAGSGNAVTALSVSNGVLTYTKGSTFLTAHPTIPVETDTTSTASPDHGGTFTAVDSVTRDTNGHVKKINTKTVTLPAQYTHPTYTARTGKPTGNETPAFGATFTISQIKSDGTGHVTAATDRTVKIPDTTMGAATADTAGTIGLVPAPAAGKQSSFLRGDGTWVVPTNTDTKVTQNVSSADKKYPVLLSYYENTDNTTTAQTVNRVNTIYANPNSGYLWTKALQSPTWGTAPTSSAPSSASFTLSDIGLYFRSRYLSEDGNAYDYSRPVLRTYKGKHNNSGMVVSLDSGGLTIVGGGESATSLAGLISDDQHSTSTTPTTLDVGGTLNTAFNGSAEQLLLSSDNNIYFITKCNTIDQRQPVVLDTSLQFYPGTNETGSIGTSSYKWGSIYVNKIFPGSGVYYNNNSDFASAPWAKTADFTCGSASVTRWYAFRVYQGYEGTTIGSGLLIVEITTNANKVYSSGKVVWVYAAGSLDKDNFAITYTDTASTSTTIAIWAKCTKRYQSWHVIPLYGGWGSGRGDLGINCYSTTTGEAAYTGTLIASEYASIKNNAASANKLNTDAGSATQPVYFSNGVPVAVTQAASGAWFGTVPYVRSADGVMEIGRIIDFHNTSSSTADYNIRLDNISTTSLRFSEVNATAGANFSPATNNKYDLGTSSLKWRNVYATTFYGDLNGTINTATTATTQTKGDNSTQVATTAFVQTAIGDYIPLSGSSAISGDLKMNVTNKGFWLVDTAGNSYPGMKDNNANLWIGAADSNSPHHVGNVFIAAGYDSASSKGNLSINIYAPNAANTKGAATWTMYHTGNLLAGTGLQRDSAVSTTYNGTVWTINHSNSVTADTAKGDDSKTLTFGGTFTIPSVTYDAQGHVTAKGTTTMTMPANPNTDTKVTQTNTASTDANYRVLLSANANDTTETTTARKNTNLYYNPSTGVLRSARLTLQSATIPLVNLNLSTLQPTAGQNINVIGITYRNADNTKNYTAYPIGILGNDASDGYNTGVRLGSQNGTTIVGAGESSVTFAAAKGKYNDENIYLVADGSVFMYRGMSYDSTTGSGPWTMGGFTATPVDGQVVIADGTVGGYKTSGYTIAKSVPSDAVFTDHITTATTSGSGNAVTAISADANGALTVTKGTTFLTSSTQYISSIESSGSGNAVTSLSVSSGKLTYTKGSTFLTAHPTIPVSTDTTSTASPAFGGTFTAVDSVTRDSNGHVTKINTKTVTVPGTTMGAATADNAGTKGLVPAPAAGKQSSFLRGDGTWVVPTNTDTTYTLSGAYGTNSNTWVTTLTPSSGSATTSTVPTASTSVYGITKLSSSTSSTSTSLAATASAVKAAYDRCDSYIPLAGSSAISGNLAFNASQKGVFLKDSVSKVFAGIYYNGINFWIGSEQATATHFTGSTMISAGYSSSASKGNLTIKVYTVNAANTDATGRDVFHTANLFAGTGLTFATAASTDYNGTIYTINHSNSITAGTVGDQSAKTLTWSDTFKVPKVVYDAQGHITTGTTDITITMPANPNTDEKVKQSTTNVASYRPIVLGYTYSTTVSNLDATVTNQVFVTTKLYTQPSTGNLYMHGKCIIGTSSQSSYPTGGIHVHDVRSVDVTPDVAAGKSANFYFHQYTLDGTNNYFWGVLNVRPWDGGYSSWEIAGPAHIVDQRTTPLYVRTSNKNTAWGNWRKIYDTANKPTAADVGAVPNTKAGMNAAIDLLDTGADSIEMTDSTTFISHDINASTVAYLKRSNIVMYNYIYKKLQHNNAMDVSHTFAHWNTVGWHRCFSMPCSATASGRIIRTLEITVYRAYNDGRPEYFKVRLVGLYNATESFDVLYQKSNTAATQYFTKIRMVKSADSKTLYIDLYYNSTTSNSNTMYVKWYDSLNSSYGSSNITWSSDEDAKAVQDDSLTVVATLDIPWIAGDGYYKGSTGHWGVMFPGGSTAGWLRTSSSGLLPNTSGGLTRGSGSSLGESAWAFLYGYIKSIHSVNLNVYNSTATYKHEITSIASANRTVTLPDTNCTVGTGFFYVLGTQNEKTRMWTGNLPIPALYDGLTIAFYLPFDVKQETTDINDGNVTNVWIKLTLSNGTTTDWVPAYWTNQSRLTTHFAAGSTVMLTYMSNPQVNGSPAAVPVTGWPSNARWTRADYNSNSDTKVNVTLNTTSKAYLLATTSTPTSTAAAVTSIADTGVYLDTTAGMLTATSFRANNHIRIYDADNTSRYTQIKYKSTIAGSVSQYLPTVDGEIQVSQGQTVLYNGTVSLTSSTQLTISGDGELSDYRLLLMEFWAPGSGNSHHIVVPWQYVRSQSSGTYVWFQSLPAGQSSDATSANHNNCMGILSDSGGSSYSTKIVLKPGGNFTGSWLIRVYALI